MTETKKFPQPIGRTIFLFGDATESWVDCLDRVYKQSVSTPWLKIFLEKMTNVIVAEARSTTMDRSLQGSLGHFSSLQELGERYRHSPDPFGVVQAILLHAVRASTLLQWVKREPELVGPNASTEWIGLSGGLLSVSALAIAEDFEMLYEACLETARFVLRVAKLTSVKSRAMEEQPGTWSWAVAGISPGELREALEKFQQTNGIVSKKAKVGVVGNGWNTIIGPPSVLELFLTQCHAVRHLAKSPLAVHAAQHTLDITTADIEYMVGNNLAFLDRPISCPNHRLWGMDNPAATYANWGAMLKEICAQILSRPLDITQVMSQLSSGLGSASVITVLQPGTSIHAPYLASVLKKPEREIFVRDQPNLQAEDRTLVKPGRIAIVGMAGRGPGSKNVDEFWDLIMAKQDLCSEVPKDRFDIDEYYCEAHERGEERCKMKVRYGCFMDNPGHFDSRFFHISPREAILMDPNHRQFLMSTYEALESAGYSDGQTKSIDPHRIAAFFAQATDDWHKQTHPTLGCDSYTLQGIQRAFGPGRLAWQFKWEGPTYALDSACAGTTASIHLACLSLLERDVDMAVAGAANILSWPHSFTCLDDAGILSPTGNCKTFRDDADGYCRGDFVGSVVLKRLEDAIAHNDNILAVIAASGRNHSGNSTSITTSDAAAQERLFQKVLLKAQLTPDDISYVEMHGTGTQTGDPAEIGAIANTFRRRRRDKGPLPVGGVKANFGHSEAAAGMAELLKCIKMFQTDTIPPQAGMPHALNPKFPPLVDVNIEIPSEPKPFRRDLEEPRRILLNNFDAAGGNACMVLEEFIPTDFDQQRTKDPRPSHVITVSARTKAAYHENKRRLVEWLRANPATRIEDIAYTTTARRMHHPFRFACTATSTQDIINRLEATDTTSSASPSSQPFVFVFTGQGAQYAGMGGELYRTSPIFRETVDMCVALCDANAFPAFLDIITNTEVDVSTKNTAQIQLALVTVELALTAFWRSAGIEPAMVVGHSLGEYAALYAAQVLSLADCLYLVGSRALMLLERCEADSCSMLSVTASVATVQDCLAQLPSSSCSVACINSPSATVVSGTAEDLARFQAQITALDAKVRTRPLPVPFAFHSFQVDPILDDYTSLAAGVTFSPPKVPVSSTLLGSVINKPGIFNQDYLSQQTRQPVDFLKALKSIESKLNDPVWLEIGPSPVCVSFVRSTLAPPPAKIQYSIEANTSNWTSISKALSATYTSGADIDWLAFHRPFEGDLELLALPGYAWDMKDYWVTYTDRGRTPTDAPKTTQAVLHEPPLSTCAQYLVQSSSTPDIKVTFRASLSDPAFLALIDDHKMQQVGLCSGSVFCDAALTVAKYALNYSGRKDITTRSLTLHDPELLAPLTRTLVGVEGELHTTAVMESASANTIMVYFKATSSRASHDLGTMRVQVRDPEKLQANWDRVSYFIKAKMEERIRSSKDGSGHRLQPEVLYALFSKNVEFGPAFKRIQEGYIARDYQDAAAVVVLDKDPPGSRFTFSPYWGEALAHLAGFMVNGNPNSNPRTTFIVMGFGSVEQTVDFAPGKKYLSYTRISRWDRNTAICDAYIFDADSSKLVMQCTDLRYQELPRAVWKNILEGGHAGSSHSATAKPDKESAVKKMNGSDTAKTLAPAGETAVAATPEAEKAPDSRVFDIILDSIVKATGTDRSELTHETLIADLGVDSIMAIEVVSAVREQTGVDLPAQFVFEYPSVGALHREFVGLPEPLAAPEAPEQSDTDLSWISPSTLASVIELPDAGIVTPEVPTAEGSATLVEKKTIAHEAEGGKTKRQDAQPIDDGSPPPNTRITLLQGRPGPNKTPFYLMADGTGSIATYIHLPVFKGGRPIYGVDSPFLRCPSRLTPEIGIEGVATLVIEALIKHHPKGNFVIGGFSAGSTVAYEVARQLPEAGRKVDGLLIMDLCCPRPDSGLLDESTVNRETDVGITIFGAAAAVDGLWTSTGLTRDHLRAYLSAMRNYHPPPMTAQGRPAAAAVIWAEKGMVNRVKDNPDAMKMLVDNGIPIEPYPGFMEDPNNGPFACFIPDKTEADLGPNGWDRFVGDILCLSMCSDHLDMPMPGHVHLLHEQITKVLAHFDSRS